MVSKTLHKSERGAAMAEREWGGRDVGAEMGDKEGGAGMGAGILSIDGAEMRALASNQCGMGSILPYVG